ncbi:MAG: HK97 family phage prohead protease [Parvularculaceae bacterium]
MLEHGSAPAERRRSLEIRRVSGRKLAGLAAPYGALANIGAYQERIAPGAFAKTLRGPEEVIALFDHGPTRLLARRSTGTLRLSDSAEGLAFEIELPVTTAGNDALALAERGDLGGASIGFVVREDGESWSGNIRTLTDVGLMEISVVSPWPAYAETSVEARRGRMLQAANTPRRDALRRYLDTV